MQFKSLYALGTTAKFYRNFFSYTFIKKNIKKNRTNCVYYSIAYWYFIKMEARKSNFCRSIHILFYRCGLFGDIGCEA